MNDSFFPFCQLGWDQINNISVLPHSYLIHLILYGSNVFNDISNKLILQSSIRFIKHTTKGLILSKLSKIEVHLSPIIDVTYCLYCFFMFVHFCFYICSFGFRNKLVNIKYNINIPVSSCIVYLLIY